MKTKLIISLILVILSFSFIYNNAEREEAAGMRASLVTPPPAPNRWLDKFYIGAISDEQDWYYHDEQIPRFGQLDLLGFNLWHAYVWGEHDQISDRYYPVMAWGEHGGNFSDKLFDNVTDYADEVNAVIGDIYSHDGRKLIIMRPKIEWLCYGQRSDYQCEDTTNIFTCNPQLWFYAFNSNDTTHTYTGETWQDDTPYGNDAYVKRCLIGTHQQGYVVDRLKANTEQCRRVGSNDGNQWQGDSYCDWLIKPRIRIDSVFANNPANFNIPVCSLNIRNQAGNVFKEVVLNVKHFLVDTLGTYNGRYLEEYKYYLEDTAKLIYQHGDWATGADQWAYTARGNAAEDQWCNKADIQVYWYGNCDMWIDYVRVDNDVAHNLFGTGQTHDLYEQWLEDEVHYIAANQVNGEYPILKYYLELVEFNNLPCMAYVNQKLKYWSNYYSSGQVTIDLMQDLTHHYAVHVNWESQDRLLNADFLKSQYIDKVGFTQIFAQLYPLEGCSSTNPGDQSFSIIPSTLPTTSGGKIFSQVQSPSDYDDWLQDNLNHYPSYWEGGDVGGRCTEGNTGLAQWYGHFRSELQICNQVSKAADIPFIFMPQAHQWYCSNEVHREPTNEELDMMINVAVSYGARGLLFWEYPSEYRSSTDYGIGITETWGGPLRKENCYGQGHVYEMPYKWEVFQSIADRMTNKWGPTLMSFDFDNTNSYIYDFENERYTLLQNSYFRDVVTYKPGSGYPLCQDDNPGESDPPGMIYECREERYVQVATFKQDGSTTPYFMIVNRRCSPHRPDISENGGKRLIKVSFDPNSPSFPVYRTWKILDIANDRWSVEFDKTTGLLVTLGDFKPGEGRLYKIVPVQ